ncbi:MAG: hypothetical protein M3406_11305 [Chloroflexota bacterium]|nr:hypothetical protein [Chloroflexota bacterium]
MLMFGAFAAIAAGPLFLVSQATEQNALGAASMVLFALGLTALQGIQGGFWSTKQVIGFSVMIAGFAMMLLGAVLADVSRLATPSPIDTIAWVALPWGFHVVLPLGLLVYAVGSLQSDVLPAWMKAWLGLMATAGAVTVVITGLVWSGTASTDQLFLLLAMAGVPFLLGWSVIGAGMLAMNKR